MILPRPLDLYNSWKKNFFYQINKLFFLILYYNEIVTT